MLAAHGRRSVELPDVLPLRTLAAALLAAAAAAAAVASGCGAPGGGDDAGSGSSDAGPLTVELGTGRVAFEDLPAGAPIAVYAGAQGGYHVYGSVLVTGGCTCTNATVVFRVLDGADGVTVLGEVTYSGVDLTPAAGGKVYAGVPVILGGWNGVPFAQAMGELSGRPFLLEVTLTDGAGQSVAAAVDVVGDCCS